MAKRIIKNLKIFNNFTCCYCFILVSLFLQLTTIIADDAEPSVATLNATSGETNATFLTPIAEALVRYRRQPLTFVKHIIRPKRYKVKRIKRPKIKYSFAEPPPQLYYKSKPSPPMKHAPPIFDTSIFEDFSHINVESADFNAPPLSYEAQSMDLDLYSSYEKSAEELYKSSKKPTYTYTEPEPEISYKEHSNIPTYSFESPKKSIRKPHTKYGVPTEYVYSTAFEKPGGSVNNYDGYNEASYEPSKLGEETHKYQSIPYEPSKVIESSGYHPAAYEPSKVAEKPTYIRPDEDKYTYAKPVEPHPRIPATTYGIPDMPIPSKNFDNYNKYSLVEHQPGQYDSFETFKGNQHHFAEPPEQKVEIMYSPSYEINIPPSSSHREEYPSDYESHGPPEQYETPAKHHPAGGHSPYQESSDTHQPPSYEPAPSQNLPINQNHKHPTYDYPKSSYEVPIYDPIPFDSSTTQEREIYPPNSSWKEAEPEYIADANNISEQRPNHPVETAHDNESDERPAGDTHSSGTRPTTDIIPPRLQRTRKRKRTKASTSATLSSTKHILDVPELQQAFENERRHQGRHKENHHQPKIVDTAFTGSQKVETANKNNENSNNNRWNPMRIQTRPILVTTPPPTVALNHHHYQASANRPHIYRTRATSTTESPSPSPTPSPTSAETKQQQPSNVEIVSIQKSRSKSFYDGILSTPKIYNPSLYNRNRYKTQPTTASTTTSAPSQTNAGSKERFYKRTTKNVFDTTIFKSPLTDRDVYRNLPKNHKLF